ncbi:MAG: hypothetical protein ACR2M7_01675 [Bdellovibrionales bacterium]
MFKACSFYHAFFGGSDFWAICLDPKDFWFKKINWQTKFLIQKIKPTTTVKQSLIVSTDSFFPNKAVLCIPPQKKLWIQEVHKHWVNFKKPTLRIFLKDHETLEDLKNNWPKQDWTDSISYLNPHEF